MSSNRFALVLAVAASMAASTVAFAADKPGVVSRISVVSDKVHDVSSLEAWKKSFIKDSMTETEKMMAIFKSNVMFQTADMPPNEHLQRGSNVLDPIKLFNVYGYTFCSVSAANMACLAKYVGLKARNATINNHTIPDIYADGAWHMMDADLIQYFPKADGTIASLPEIVEGIQAWLKENPDFPQGLPNKQARYKWMREKDWKNKGPEILSRNPYFAHHGWLPCVTFAWGDTMHQFSRIDNHWESCYSMGYEVNIQLRPGEKLIRNWSNKGLHVNMMDGGKPASLNPSKPDSFRHKDWGDRAPGRIGNGTLEYDVPFAGGEFRGGALQAENLQETGKGIRVKDAASPAVLDIRMPSSYVFLGGFAQATAAIEGDGEIKFLISDNNGLEWKPVATLAAGENKVDLKPYVFRRYSYILRVVMKGSNTGLDSLKLSNDIQHSQRALPALAQGENTITFTSGAQEGTITIEGAMDLQAKDAGKQLRYADFRPQVEVFNLARMPASNNNGGSVTFPVKTPGEISQIRASNYFVSQGRESMFITDVSFDDGATWKTIDQPTEADLWQESRKFVSRYAKATDVPAGTKSAFVRYRAVGRNTVTLVNARIDADYKEPTGGFRPVQVTYNWEEGGLDKKDVFVAKSPNETYKIKCESTPVLKSIVLELAR